MINKWTWDTAHETKGAGIIIVKKKKDNWKVLGLWANGGYDIPKGHVEADDKVFQTAIRETYEEARISNLDFQWGKVHIQIKNLFVFLASTEENPKIVLNKEENIFEHEFAKWLDWKTMKEECYDYLVPAIKWAEMKVEK